MAQSKKEKNGFGQTWLSDAFAAALVRDLFLPGETYQGGKKNFHVNKHGARKHYGQKFNDKGHVVSDRVSWTFDNGLTLEVRRHFKKAYKKKAYEKAIRISDYSDLRKNVKRYDATIPEFEALPEGVQIAIYGIVEGVFETHKKGKSDNKPETTIKTEKTSAINKLAKKMAALPNFDSPADEYANDGFENISAFERGFIPWILRRDRTFVPDIFEKEGHNFVRGEARTYLFANGYGVRVKRVFDPPYHENDYLDYKQKLNKTIEKERAAKTLELFEENKHDILQGVSEFRIAPAFLLDPSYDHEKPYVGLKGVIKISKAIGAVSGDPMEDFNNLLSIFSRFERIENDGKPYYVSKTGYDVSLAMYEISKLPPHPFATDPDDLPKMIERAQKRLHDAEFKQRMDFV